MNGKELFPTDSGPEVFYGIVGDHPEVYSCLSGTGQGAYLGVEQSALSICAANQSDICRALKTFCPFSSPKGVSSKCPLVSRGLVDQLFG